MPQPDPRLRYRPDLDALIELYRSGLLSYPEAGADQITPPGLPPEYAEGGLDTLPVRTGSAVPPQQAPIAEGDYAGGVLSRMGNSLRNRILGRGPIR